MAGITTPPVIVEPFGINALSANITLPIPVASQIGITNGAASYNDGFPPDTMIPVVAGGTPPFGQDFNGILYTITASLAAIQAGQPWLYSATIVAAIGGYPVGTIVGSSDGSGLWINTVAANVTDPDGATPGGWAAFGNTGQASITGLTNANVTLSPVQYKKPLLVLSGALTGNILIILPTTLSQQWLVVNNCTGAFIVQVRTVAGTGVTVPAGGPGSPTGVYCDGTNIQPSTAPLAVPISIAATPSTLVERDNNGYVYATYLNQSSALENPAIGSIFCNTTANDGFLRKISNANFITQLGLDTVTARNAAITAAISAALASYSTTTAMNTAIAAAAAAVVTTGTNANGRWMRFANGVIKQWGVKTGGGAGAVTVTFPISFVNACESIVATACGVQGTILTSLPSASKTTFQLTNGAAGSSTSWEASGT